MPGDPALVMAGEERGDPQVLAQIRAELWLDRPLPVQYLHWVGNLLHGNLGYSWRIRQPVAARNGDSETLTKQAAPGQGWLLWSWRHHPNVDSSVEYALAEGFRGSFFERECHAR